MPIKLSNIQLEYKSLPIVFHEDGRVEITLRKGFSNADGTFTAIASESFLATAEEAAVILDASPRQGLSRRNDLSLSLYEFCISKGAEVGEIN